MRFPLALTLALGAPLFAGAQAASPVSGETPFTAAVWLNHALMASGEPAITDFLDACQARGIDVVMPNVWYRGLVPYPGSEFAPQDPRFEGWDPIEVVVREAHARGLRVWPWSEYGFFAHADMAGGMEDPGPILTAHPEWQIADREGRIGLFNRGLGATHFSMNPAHPAARRFLIDLHLELARRYAVDGVNLDRIRYMSPDWGFDAYSQARFAEDRGVDHSAPDAFDRWRALQCTLFMREFAAAWRAAHPDLPITAAVNPPHMFEAKFQHWQEWVAEGTLDVAVPMIYGGDDFVRRECERTAQMLPPGARWLAGLDAAPGDASLARQVAIARQCGAAGVAIWSDQTWLRGTLVFP